MYTFTINLAGFTIQDPTSNKKHPTSIAESKIYIAQEHLLQSLRTIATPSDTNYISNVKFEVTYPSLSSFVGEYSSDYPLVAASDYSGVSAKVDADEAAYREYFANKYDTETMDKFVEVLRENKTAEYEKEADELEIANAVLRGSILALNTSTVSGRSYSTVTVPAGKTLAPGAAGGAGTPATDTIVSDYTSVTFNITNVSGSKNTITITTIGF